MKNRMIKLLGHLSIVFGLLFIAFQILDNYNPMQGYLQNAVNIGLLYAFCLISIINGIFVIWRKV